MMTAYSNDAVSMLGTYRHPFFMKRISPTGFTLLKVYSRMLKANFTPLKVNFTNSVYLHDFRIDPNWIKRNLCPLRGIDLSPYECSTLSKYDYILSLTEIDAKLLSSVVNPKTRIIVSPAAILKDYTGMIGKFKSATNRLTFVGSFHHIGNVPELKILGFVEDLDAAMRGSISIVPVRIGSGMRMKILDTITAPAPLVTTAKGVEGIDLRIGIDCLIADTPQEFANCIVELCRKEELQRKLVDNAFQRLEGMYVPQEMIEKRCNFYDELMSNL